MWNSLQPYLKLCWLVLSSGGCFTNISRALQNKLAKIYNAKNHIYGENFKLKLGTCAQSIAWLWAPVQSFILKFSQEVRFLIYTNFERISWRACKTLVKQPPGPLFNKQWNDLNQILQKLEAVKHAFRGIQSLWNLQVSLQQCCQSTCQIWERCNEFNTQSHGFRVLIQYKDDIFPV